MPRKPRQRRRNRGAPPWLPYNDYVGGVLGPGDQALWRRSNFSIPRDRQFYVMGVNVQVVTEAASATQEFVGHACLQVELYNPTSSSKSAQFWNSDPIVVGPIPYSRNFRMKSLPWTDATPPEVTLAAFTNICQRKTDTGSIRYVARLDVMMSPKEFSRTCPNNLSGPITSLSDSVSSLSLLEADLAPPHPREVVERA
ncbi:hypothetical protein QE152_g9520 [Popillia japonica]|uniref:Capsid protein n=1 Tax=Popillia japonica TaxID=7064 RepID=A0AAW1LZ45_POPJA